MRVRPAALLWAAAGGKGEGEVEEEAKAWVARGAYKEKVAEVGGGENVEEERGTPKIASGGAGGRTNAGCLAGWPFCSWKWKEHKHVRDRLVFVSPALMNDDHLPCIVSSPSVIV